MKQNFLDGQGKANKIFPSAEFLSNFQRIKLIPRFDQHVTPTSYEISKILIFLKYLTKEKLQDSSSCTMREELCPTGNYTSVKLVGWFHSSGIALMTWKRHIFNVSSFFLSLHRPEHSETFMLGVANNLPARQHIYGWTKERNTFVI